MSVSTPDIQVPGPPPRPAWSAGRVLATIAAALFLLLGTGMLLGGTALRLVDGPLRDDQGYLMASSERWQSPGYAVRSEAAEIHSGSTVLDLPGRLLGTLRASADPATANGVFIGVARTADVDRYLDGVAHSTMVGGSMGRRQDPMMSGTRFIDGGSPAVAPTDATFWVASSSGPGEQTITWEPEDGSWTLVVMNGEGTTPVDADVAVGAELPVLGTAGTALIISGLLVVVASATGLWLALRRR
jgi:hypothetical protein